MSEIFSWVAITYRCFSLFTDTSTLNNAIGFTAKTYHEIAEMHAEQVGCN